MKEEIIIAGFGGQGVLSMDARLWPRTTRWNSQRYSYCK